MNGYKQLGDTIFAYIGRHGIRVIIVWFRRVVGIFVTGLVGILITTGLMKVCIITRDQKHTIIVVVLCSIRINTGFTNNINKLLIDLIC